MLSGAAGVSCIFSRIRVAFWGFVCRTVASFFFRLELGRRPARYILLESRRDGSRAYMCALGCGEPLSPFYTDYKNKRAETLRDLACRTQPAASRSDKRAREISVPDPAGSLQT